MSILLSIFLLVGVATCRHVSIHNDASSGASVEPIKLPEARRICASLCMSGLGGKPCGGDCLNIGPAGFQSQSENNITDKLVAAVAGRSRRDACPLLCQYQLGEPLCDCPPQVAKFDSIFFQIDFDKICSFFCKQYRYKIFGCSPCSDKDEEEIVPLQPIEPFIETKEIDWNAWCREKCSEGDGGVACNCDILPMSFEKKKLHQPTETKE